MIIMINFLDGSFLLPVYTQYKGFTTIENYLFTRIYRCMRKEAEVSLLLSHLFNLSQRKRDTFVVLDKT